MIKMHFDLIPKNLKDQLDFYNFKLREFKILTKSLKVKNLQIDWSKSRKNFESTPTPPPPN